MSIRVIVKVEDSSQAAHVGGDVHVSYRTYDIEAPELEQYLRDKTNNWQARNVIGVELP